MYYNIHDPNRSRIKLNILRLGYRTTEPLRYIPTMFFKYKYNIFDLII